MLQRKLNRSTPLWAMLVLAPVVVGAACGGSGLDASTKSTVSGVTGAVAGSNVGGTPRPGNNSATTGGGDSSASANLAAPEVTDTAPGTGAIESPDTAPDTTPDSTAGTAPSSSEDALDEVRTAIDNEDFCGVYAGLSKFEIPASATERDRVLDLVRDTMEEASDFADSRIRTDWRILLDMIGGVVGASGSGGSNERTDAQVVAALESPEFLEAQQHVERWMDANCG